MSALSDCPFLPKNADPPMYGWSLPRRLENITLVEYVCSTLPQRFIKIDLRALYARFVWTLYPAIRNWSGENVWLACLLLSSQ
jgi:hypothetical protein